MRNTVRARVVALLALAVVVLVVAGAFVLIGRDGEVSPRVAPLPTTTLPESEGPDDPLRILLAGDSVMVGLAPAIEAALDVPEVQDVRFILTPTVLRDPSVRFAWQQQMDDFEPDVVVMLVGVWEGEDDDRELAVAEDPDTARAWQISYGEEVLEPWTAEVTDQGAAVLWIGAPPVAHEDLMDYFASLNASIERVASRSLDTAYLSPDVLGTGWNDVPTELPVGNGATIRLRHVDGLHLCPPGSVLLAEQVVAWLDSVFETGSSDGWTTEAWIDDEELYPNHACG